MQVKHIDETFAVSPQITPAEMAELAAAGFRAIVCNRPDGEGPGQPSSAEVAAAARAAGLGFRYLPVTPGRVGDPEAQAFAAALRELPGPVLAYCRTGARSATLWSLSEAVRRAKPAAHP